MQQQNDGGITTQQNYQKEEGGSWISVYYEAAKAGFYRIWNNRFLWFWGFFLPVGMGASFNYNFSPEENRMEGSENVDFANAMQQFGNYVHENLAWFVIGFSIFILLSVVIWIISAIARRGVTQAVEQLQNPTASLTYNFKEVWNQGKTGFGRIMLFDLAIGAILMLIGLLLALPMITLLIRGQFGFLIFIGILAILIYIPIGILGYFLKTSGVIIHVLSGTGVKRSIEIAYEYVSKNIKEAIKLILTFLVMGLLHGIVVISVIISMMIIAAILGFFFFVVFGFQAIDESGLILLAIISGVIALVVLMGALFVVKAFFSVWTWDIWVWWTKKVGAKYEKQLKDDLSEVERSAEQKVSTTLE
jgi:hypothetical protein